MAAWLPVDGGMLPVWRTGKGPPIVLVHGWTLNAGVWAPQVAALSGDHTVITFDRRGFGGSTAPPGLAAEPDDLRAILDMFGLDRAIIVAMSQGCRPALAFAARNPARVSALVLQGAPFVSDPPAAAPDRGAALVEMRTCATIGDVERMRALALADPLLHVRTAAARAMLRTIVERYEGRDLRVPSEHLDLSVEVLTRIPAPVLVMVGAFDSVTRQAAATFLAQRLPDARRVEVPDGSHLCNLDAPETFLALLMRFLSETQDRVATRGAALAQLGGR